MANSRSLAGRAVEQAVLLANRLGIDVTRELFKHRFLPALAGRGVDTVLDIGANTGQFGRQLRRAGYRDRIHSVEPLADAFAQLQRAAGRDRRWTVERAAVSDAAGTLTMNVSQNSVSSSVLPILERSVAAAPQTRYVATEPVPATTVDDLVAEHRLVPDRTLLKVDVQGYEQAVLAGAAKTLERFAAIRTEMSLVALYEGQVLMPELVEALTGRGFELWFLEPGFSEPGTRRLLQLDGVFLRREPA
jgi:FkbM family methyltransferase